MNENQKVNINDFLFGEGTPRAEAAKEMDAAQDAEEEAIQNGWIAPPTPEWEE